MSNDGRLNHWFKSNLAAVGSAAVMTVYAAGYAKTKPAADRLAEESDRRRPPMQPPATVSSGHVDAEPTPVALAPSRAESAGVTVAGAKTATPNRPSVAVESAPPAPTKKDSSNVAANRSPNAATNTVVPPVSQTSAAVPAAPAPAAPPVAAAASTPAPQPAQDTAAKSVGYKDGLYTGWGTSRHGDIQAYVEVKNGKIASAFISECLTQYSCSWIAKLPPQVVERQSPETDYVSGATQSSNAFYYAVLNALKQAK
jgi:uncharacterized protein with FMN-binding domain